MPAEGGSKRLKNSFLSIVSRGNYFIFFLAKILVLALNSFTIFSKEYQCPLYSVMLKFFIK